MQNKIDDEHKLLNEFAVELKSLILKSNEYFEKQLTYISAGALGLSMLISEKIIKDLSVTKCKWMLFFTWILLGLTLVSNLISHLYTSKLHNKTLEEINEKKYDYGKAVYRNKCINVWNFFSVALLLIGLVFQILFLIKNLN